MSTKSFIISVLLFIFSICCLILLSTRGAQIVVSTNLEHLPVTIDSFSATEDTFSEAVYKELNADLHLYRHYRSKQGEQIDLYIGYYGTAKGGRTPHNPYGCLPSSGWAILDEKRINIKTQTYPTKTDVNYILSKKDETYNIMFHWYQSDRNKILLSGFQQNIQRFSGNIFHNKNDGAFIRISTLSSTNDIEKNIDMVSSFAAKFLDVLPQYWPTEQPR